MKAYKLTYDYKSFCKPYKRITSHRGLQAFRYIKDKGSPETSLASALEKFLEWPQFPNGCRFIKTYASGPALVSINRLMVSVMYNFRLEKDEEKPEA